MSRRRQRMLTEARRTAILRKIAERDEVSDEDILELFQINSPACKGCSVNYKASPNCFCQLIPSKRLCKSGSVWQEKSDLEAMLGGDPQKWLRSSTALPSGLRNLGATCYANSILQCLYRIKPVIQAIFAVEPELLKKESILLNLQVLFGELCLGRRKAVDPAPFLEALDLKDSPQQDAHEFLKHLLFALQYLLRQSKKDTVKNIVQDVFQGSMSYTTRCSTCNQESLKSKEVKDFYELALNVDGLSSLNESLDDYLKVEQLTGDNQYFCESCNARRDAACFTILRSLPSVLIFQLNCFIHNVKTAKDEKVMSKLSFPQVLDMTTRLKVDGSRGPHAESSLLYDLSCVVIHKGSTPYQGHYIANVKDDDNQQWWELNDELVTSLGSYQGASYGAAANSMSTSDTQTHEGATDRFENCLILTDPYILLYNRRESVDATRVSINDNLLHLLPEDLRIKIEAENNKLQKICVDYKSNLEKELSDRAERKNEITIVSNELQCQGQDNRYFWISSGWLQTWAAELKPPPIDNTNLLCEHNKVSPSSVRVMKRISEKAWASLTSQYGGGPELTAKDCCIECIKNIAKNVGLANAFKNERMKIKQLLGHAGVTNPAGRYFLVSRNWLQKLLHRKSAEASTEVNASPTAAITCSHKALLPEYFKGAECQKVAENVWDYFSQIARKVQQKDMDEGLVSFPADTPTCSICDTQTVGVTSQQQDQKNIKMKRRRKLEALSTVGIISIVPGSVYYLVPSVWLRQWCSYLIATGKTSQKAEKPLGLRKSLRDLFCEKHKCLLHKAPQLQRNQRSELVQGNLDDDIFRIVSEEKWKDFCSIWNKKGCPSIKAWLEEMKQVGTNSRSEEGTVRIKGSRVSLDDINTQILLTKPKVCNICIKEREKSDCTRKCESNNKEVFVDLATQNELPKAEQNVADRDSSKKDFKGTKLLKLATLSSSFDSDVS